MHRKEYIKNTHLQTCKIQITLDACHKFITRHIFILQPSEEQLVTTVMKQFPFVVVIMQVMKWVRGTLHHGGKHSKLFQLILQPFTVSTCMPRFIGISFFFQPSKQSFATTVLKLPPGLAVIKRSACDGWQRHVYGCMKAAPQEGVCAIPACSICAMIDVHQVRVIPFHVC